MATDDPTISDQRPCASPGCVADSYYWTTSDAGQEWWCEAHGPGRKNHSTPCVVCEALPTVGDTELCGPCCFGEAETADGNW